jgi:hypothetical protein
MADNLVCFSILRLNYRFILEDFHEDKFVCDNVSELELRFLTDLDQVKQVICMAKSAFPRLKSFYLKLKAHDSTMFRKVC